MRIDTDQTIIKHQDPTGACNKKGNSERCFPLAVEGTLFIVPKICQFLWCLALSVSSCANEDKAKVDSDGP